MQRSTRDIVANALAIVDPFDELKLPATLESTSPYPFELRYVTGPQLSKEETNWMIDSIETSLRHFYDSSTMEWSRREKLNDTRHAHQRFLFVSHKELGSRVAFLSFRWDVEEKEPIMYIYELFVEPSARGNRVAIALMKYAESLCRKLHVRTLMLTVFCKNEAAMQLYRNRLGYVIDEDSPSRYGIENVGYEILSKMLSGEMSES